MARGWHRPLCGYSVVYRVFHLVVVHRWAWPGTNLLTMSEERLESTSGRK